MPADRIPIALVDDDDLFREALSDLLELSGLDVEQYASGDAFLTRANGTKATCLVIDVQLPDITGIELARQLAHQGSSLPVIFITGSADTAFEKQAAELGCAAFLRKPFRRDALLEAIMSATAPSERQNG